MNAHQLAALLARIQVLDNRNLDKTTHDVWTRIIGDLNYDDALEAVNYHFRTTGDYLKPVHIVDGVKRINEARAMKVVQSAHDRVCRVHNHRTRDGEYRACQSHHYDAGSAWCHNGCGWRVDGQSEYNPRGEREQPRDWVA